MKITVYEYSATIPGKGRERRFYFWARQALAAYEAAGTAGAVSRGWGPVYLLLW